MSDARADDAALIGRIASGDKAAFATIYDRHLPLVLRWSLRETGSREVAVDLAGETFAAALIVSLPYRPEFSSILRGIVRATVDLLSDRCLHS
jgi:DNA-directed RNA polymerase specialized sigma24 family protein